jgi:tRNA (Thr-GGU) A37 N-methylase
MEAISYTSIGIVHSPHSDPAQTPKQTESARGIAGTVELNAELAGGLKDLAEFDYIWLVVHMHKAVETRDVWLEQSGDKGNKGELGEIEGDKGQKGNESVAANPERAAYSLEVVTSKAEPAHGVFATRAPYRPNAIGLSLVRLVRIEGSTLHIEDVDLLDGTPVLDIKPYVPKLDNRQTERIGWFARRLK